MAASRAFKLTLNPGNRSRGDNAEFETQRFPELTLSFRDLFPESSSMPAKRTAVR